MRVLVTGATGFVGANLLRLLVGEQIDVCVLMRKNSNPWRISDLLNSVTVLEGDLLDLSSWKRSLREINAEVCIHLAWYAEPGTYLTSQKNVDMAAATLELATYLSKLGCKKFVGTGTCLEYDTDAGRLSEEAATGPRTLYAICKLSTYNKLVKLSAETGLDFKWARLFYQYGPFEHEKRLVPTTIRSLLRNRNIRINNGRLTRDFLHVHDTASAIWNLATSTISGSVNVGSGSPITVRSFVEKIGDIMDRRGLFTFRDSEDKQEPRVIYADISKLKNNTNWSPLYNLETGLRNTVEWWTKRLS